MGWLFKRDESYLQNDAFVALIRAAQDDDGIRNQLISILSLEPKHRVSALNTLINEMKLRQTSMSLAAALTLFLDDQVAKKALALLQSDENA